MLKRLQNANRQVRRRLQVIVASGAILTIGIVGVSLWALYRLALEEEAIQLQAMLAVQGQLLDAVGRFDAKHSTDAVQGGAFAATMLQLQESLQDQSALGESGEILAAHRENGRVRYYAARHRNPEAINHLSPMIQAALAGKTGHQHGRDYRGEHVIGAYTWVPAVETALVFKRDIRELRAPFVAWGIRVALAMLMVLIIAIFVFRYTSKPILVELVRREKLFEGLFLNGPDAMLLLDENAEAVDCNRGAERLLGVSHDALVGQPMHYYSAAEQAQGRSAEQAISELVNNARIGSVSRFDWRFATPKGDVFDGEVGIARVDFDGKPWMAVVIRDLTDRQQMQEQLEQAQERIVEQRDALAHADRALMLGEMASSLAHEISQPLAAMQNYAAAAVRRLRQDDDNDELVLANLNKLTRQAERAADVINRTREFGRKEPVSPVAMPLSELIRSTLQLAALDFERKGVTIDVAPLPPDVSLTVDAVQLQQVLLNLLRNGMESQVSAGNAHKPMQLNVAKRKQQIDIVVLDHGTGLPTDDPESVFEPFFTTKPQGMGMGLAVSRSIAEAHGGQLTAANNPAGGAIFRLTLPMGEETQMLA